MGIEGGRTAQSGEKMPGVPGGEKSSRETLQERIEYYRTNYTALKVRLRELYKIALQEHLAVDEEMRHRFLKAFAGGGDFNDGYKGSYVRPHDAALESEYEALLRIASEREARQKKGSRQFIDFVFTEGNKEVYGQLHSDAGIGETAKNIKLAEY